MRTLDFFALLLLLLSLHSTSRAQEASFFCAGHSAPEPLAGAAAKPLADPLQPLPSQGRLHALVIFAQFKDEAHKPVPQFAEDIFAPERPGSFSHFYTTMSFGQLQVAGTVLPKRYSSERPASAYLSSAANERGDYGTFAAEVLAQVEVNIGLEQFDNDGPDGLPNSGDDDGVVDYVFIVTRSTPANFLLGRATGIVGLNDVEYLSAATSSQGRRIKISGNRNHGAIFQEGSYSRIIGTMAHEFGHSLGLPDLYDFQYGNPSEDSAGIGRWGLMGWGAHGWNGNDGPNPFCAWSREQLGWIGLNNERLVKIDADIDELEIADLDADGTIVRIPLRQRVIVQGLFVEEYLLLEYRKRDSHYYDRHLPTEGLLVWHIQPRNENNNWEEQKLVDLVCADGLYRDAGYPRGRQVDAQSGRDNLDFWSHDVSYNREHGGNLGDATDPFDGVRYTTLNVGSNPSTNVGGFVPAASSGLAVENMRTLGNTMQVDINLPRWAGTIDQEVHWIGAINVEGDLTVAPEGSLVIYGSTQVRFDGKDVLEAGKDPSRCELHIQGNLEIFFAKMTRISSRYSGKSMERVLLQPVLFSSVVQEDTWYGIVAATTGQMQMPEGSFQLQNAAFGLLSADQHPSLQASEYTTSIAEESTSHTFQLMPNYPNPFNAQTTIRYSFDEDAPVRLQVLNALGQSVRTLVDGKQSAGSHTAVWDGRSENGQNAASGIYLYHLEVAGKYAETRRMALLR